jgi:CheY-like chemotaxis protein
MPYARDREESGGAGNGRRGTNRRGAAGIRVLVVDDDQVDRIAVRRALAQAGVHRVREAEAVLPAIALLTGHAFDCVFLDYHLPDGDGLTFLRGVRAAGISVPVVMLTGQQDPRVAAQLARSGAADYVGKSDVSPARLLQALRRALPAALPAGAARGVNP